MFARCRCVSTSLESPPSLRSHGGGLLQIPQGQMQSKLRYPHALPLSALGLVFPGPVSVCLSELLCHSSIADGFIAQSLCWCLFPWLIQFS